MRPDVIVLGSFVVDAAYRSSRLPAPGETLLGSSFALGPGGKGSNQAVAAARAGAQVSLLTAVGDDAFGQLGRDLWTCERIDTAFMKTAELPTGSAAILVDDATGENAIIVVPGACGTLTAADVEGAASVIQSATVFLAQLEIPLPVVLRGLEIARAAGVTTVLNPAPAPIQRLPAELLSLVDYLIPNETELNQLTGMPVPDSGSLQRAMLHLAEHGASNVLATLGERGSVLCDAARSFMAIPAVSAGPVVDTTGAGDAFCGAFVAALAEGRLAIDAARFASAAAGIAVTRRGTAPAMAHRDEIEAPLQPPSGK